MGYVIYRGFRIYRSDEDPRRWVYADAHFGEPESDETFRTVAAAKRDIDLLWDDADAIPERIADTFGYAAPAVILGVIALIVGGALWLT